MGIYCRKIYTFRLSEHSDFETEGPVIEELENQPYAKTKNLLAFDYPLSVGLRMSGFLGLLCSITLQFGFIYSCAQETLKNYSCVDETIIFLLQKYFMHFQVCSLCHPEFIDPP